MTAAHAHEETGGLRPAQFCRELLLALESTDGRRKRRKRDTRPDSIGIDLKRQLLERAVREDPAPAEFECWLLERCLEVGPGEGAVRAMAVSIRDEWELARLAPSFRFWLAAGAPSEDRDAGSCPISREASP
jgi:hypothetical protein